MAAWLRDSTSGAAQHECDLLASITCTLPGLVPKRHTWTVWTEQGWLPRCCPLRRRPGDLASIDLHVWKRLIAADNTLSSVVTSFFVATFTQKKLLVRQAAALGQHLRLSTSLRHPTTPGPPLPTLHRASANISERVPASNLSAAA